MRIEVMIIVYPSAGRLLILLWPIMVEAPGIYANVIGCPSNFDHPAAATLEEMSNPPPGFAGTMIVTGFVGKSAA